MATSPLGGAGLSHSLYEKFADTCYHGESARIAGALEKGFPYERNPSKQARSSGEERVAGKRRHLDRARLPLLRCPLRHLHRHRTGALGVVLPPIRYVRWRYELHDDYLDIAKGIIWRKRYIIPFIRVQNTDTRQGPILRAFGLSSVTVATAAGEHAIPGLANDVADQVRDRAAELARIAREDM